MWQFVTGLVLGSCISFNSALLIFITCLFTLNPSIKTPIGHMEPRTLVRLIMDIIINKTSEVIKHYSIDSTSLPNNEK